MNVDSDLKFIGAKQCKIELLQGTQVAILQIQQVFDEAEWEFQSNGSFTFTTSQAALPTSFFPIRGTFTRSGSYINFQGEHRLGFQESSSASIDGRVDLSGNSPVLQAIYTLTWQHNTRQIAHIVQTLERGVATPKVSVEVLSSSSTSDQPEEAVLTLEENNFDIQLPKVQRQYTGFITGETETRAFTQLPIQIFIGFNQESEPPISVDLLSDPQFLTQHGGIRCNFDHSRTVESNCQISGNAQQFLLEVYSPEGTLDVSWYTLPSPSNLEEPIGVFPERVRLRLSIDGDRITGEIEGSGFYTPPSSSEIYPTTYRATLIGEQVQSRPVKRLENILETSPFTGSWQADVGFLRRITLTQDGQRVAGIYTNSEQGQSGIIDGTCQENRLDFTWTNNQQQGSGFLRAIAGGSVLTGLWFCNTSCELQTVTATWQLPQWIETTTLDWQDIQELRSLGHDLALKGRSEQAIAILDLALSYYKRERQKPETPLRNQTNFLASEAFTLAGFLPSCNFQLGNYKKLLDNLDYILEVLHLLGPEVSASRLFQERTEELTKGLKSNNYTLSLFTEGYTKVLQDLSGSPFRGTIGIYLEKQETTGDLIITHIIPNSPAALAGLSLSDRLIEIDNRQTQGMDVQQAYSTLQGLPATSITLTVQRGTQNLLFTLSRSQTILYPPHRQAELSQIVSYLLNFFEALQAQIVNFLGQLDNIETRIAGGQLDPVDAWMLLINDIANHIDHINTNLDQLLSRSVDIYAGHDSLRQDVNSLLSTFQRRTNQLDISSDTLLEKRIDHYLETTPHLSLIEKSLFKTYMQAVLVLTTFAFELDNQRSLLSRINARQLFEENRQRSLEMSSPLANRLEQWRTKIIEDQDKITALDQGQPFFGKLIGFLIELEHSQEALVASEKARSRAFADLLSSRLSIKIDSERIAQSRIADSPTLGQIQQIAKTRKSHIVEYYLVKDGDHKDSLSKIYIWVIKPTGEITFEQVDLKSLNTPLPELVINSRESIGVRGRATIEIIPIPNEQQMVKCLQQLYHLLIKPIAHHLPSDDPNAEVIFIPYQELFLVPFVALLSECGDYLIKKHTILTVPSIQLLELTHQKLKVMESRNLQLEKSSNILIVGNPTMPSVSLKVGEPPEKLLPLPGAEKEALEIATFFKTTASIGTEATKTTIISRLPNADIIHLATHGLLDYGQLQSQVHKSVPGALALAPEDGKDEGLLTSGEIFDLELNASLVVLSACDTGRGEITSDGVIGLSRSFISAGTPSIIVSLWAIPDAPTAELMKEFYCQLKLNPNKAQALRQAMLKTMEHHPHPKDWAAFILIGETQGTFIA